MHIPKQSRVQELRAMPYEKYLKTPEWIQKRDQALERDGHRCRACNSEEKLQVHHRTYERRGNEDLNDLTTLCESCHEHFHRKISQVDIMAMTYMAPRNEEDIADAKKKRMQAQEDYLIGLLIQKPSLYPHVRGILSASDFVGTDTPALYQLLGAVPDLTFEQCIPPSLRPTVSRAVEALNPAILDSDDSEQVKVLVDLAARIKCNRLAQLNEELRSLLIKAAEEGDRVTEKQLSLQMWENRKLMRLLYATRR